MFWHSATRDGLGSIKKIIMKNNHSFHHHKKFKKFYICNKDYLTPTFEALLENPDAFFNEKILKEDETFTTSVALVTIDARPIVIKRYNIKSFWHGLKRAIQPSRAARCWHYSHMLHRHCIDTPKPIAMIEKRFGPFRRQAYFISEYIEGADGFTVFRDQPVDAATTAIYATRIMELIHRLHKNLITHGDLKASNFIFHDAKPFMIDLDAMRQHKNFYRAKRKIQKDRKRFLLNWENLPVEDYFKEF